MAQAQTLAFLLINNRIRPCCPTCALRLEAAGLVRCFLTDEDNGTPLYGYQIVEPHTLEECREFMKGVKH